MRETWRLIEDWNESGWFNMAADQFLLDQCKQVQTAPTFRLYTWKRLTLTLGRHQQIQNEVDLEWCSQNQIGIIRRVTGGKAVLHGNDLTYSLVASTQDPRFSQGILPTYQTISQSFFEFFTKLHLSPQIEESHQRPPKNTHVCFTLPSAFEVLIDGRKIIGSAQRQTRNAFLQHGTIPLEDQIPLLEKIFLHATQETLRPKVTSLEAEHVYPQTSCQQLADLLKQCFEQCFQIELVQRPWSVEEYQLIAERAEQLQESQESQEPQPS